MPTQWIKIFDDDDEKQKELSLLYTRIIHARPYIHAYNPLSKVYNTLLLVLQAAHSGRVITRGKLSTDTAAGPVAPFARLTRAATPPREQEDLYLGIE